MILSGSRTATLLEVRLVDIHGTRFYDIAFAHEDTPEQRRTARIGAEDAYPNPQPGDGITVSYVMSVVTGIARRI
jgi:hypothetical protein